MFTAEWRQDLRAQPVFPCIQKLCGATGAETSAVHGNAMQLSGERGRTTSRRGVTGAVAVKDMHLLDFAPFRHDRRSIGKSPRIRRKRKPGRKVSPVGEDVEGGVRVIGEGLGRKQVRWAGMKRIGGSSGD